MNSHQNAALTPRGRAHSIERIELVGLTPAAEAAGISARTARKWQARHAQEGAAGLLDRSSRPRSSLRRSDTRKLEHGLALRRTQRLTYAQSAGELQHLDTKKLARFEQPGHRV